MTTVIPIDGLTTTVADISNAIAKRTAVTHRLPADTPLAPLLDTLARLIDLTQAMGSVIHRSPAVLTRWGDTPPVVVHVTLSALGAPPEDDPLLYSWWLAPDAPTAAIPPTYHRMTEHPTDPAIHYTTNPAVSRLNRTPPPLTADSPIAPGGDAGGGT